MNLKKGKQFLLIMSPRKGLKWNNKNKKPQNYKFWLLYSIRSLFLLSATNSPPYLNRGKTEFFLCSDSPNPFLKMDKTRATLVWRDIPGLEETSFTEPDQWRKKWFIQNSNSSRSGSRYEFACISVAEKREEKEFSPTSAQLVKHPLVFVALVPKDAALFAAGAIAGAAAKTVTAPLDRIKLLMQVFFKINLIIEFGGSSVINNSCCYRYNISTSFALFFCFLICIAGNICLIHKNFSFISNIMSSEHVNHLHLSLLVSWFENLEHITVAHYNKQDFNFFCSM